MGGAQVRRCLAATVSAGTLLAALCAAAGPAHATDGTWLAAPASSDWNTGTNWSSSPIVPDNTASFGTSTQTTLSFSAATTNINTIQFNTGASSYTFTIGAFAELNINGTGIVNNSALAPKFVTNFNGFLFFTGVSTAANATITNNSGGTLGFLGTSIAGNATITNNNGTVSFGDTSKAGNATISNNNFGTLEFFATSTAGSATITNNSGSVLQFFENSTAGLAQLINNATARVDFSFSTGPNSDNKLSAGSIAGAGVYFLGADQLTVGGNNLSTTVSGVISDCGATGTDCTAGSFSLPSTGGALVKVGTGTLTLSGANTYTGGTALNGGTLAVSSDGNLGAASGGLSFDGGTLQFLAGFTSNRTVTLNGGGGTFDTGANTANLTGDIGGIGGLTKIGAGILTLSGNNTYAGPTAINAGTLIATSNTALPGQTAVTLNSGATALAIADGVTAQIGSLADGLSGGGLVVIGSSNASTTLIIGGNASTTFSGAFLGAGSLELDNAASLTLTGASNGGNIGTIGGDLELCGCESGALTINGGSFTVNGSHGVAVFGGTLSVINGGSLQVASDLLDASNMIVSGAGSTVTVSGFTGVGIFGPASLTIASGGVLNSQLGAEIDALSGTPTATVTGAGSAWNVGAPFGFSVGNGSAGGPGLLTISNGGVVNSAGAMTIGDSVDGSSTVTVTGSGSTLNALNSLAIGATSCSCGLVGTLIVADGGVVNSPGATSIATGSTLKLGTGGLAGAIVTPAIDNAGLIAANFTDTLTLAAAISDVGALSKSGTGTLILTGSSTYTGATTVNAGKLTVNGSIASSAVTVNSGGTLAGTGTVGATTIKSGGTLAPGNSPGTMTVAGNLAFQSGALYLVQVSPSTASLANVSGTASLAGTVQAAFAPGSYMGRSYDILHSAGLGGTTFSGVSGNVPAGLTESLSYTATDVLLTLTAALGQGGGLSGNQQNVANALNAFFNNGGTLPPGFLSVFGLSGNNLANALSLISGEAATGSQQGAFQLMTEFLGLMLDPFVDGRSGFGGGGPAFGFAPERAALPDDIALAYAKVLKAPPQPPGFEQRWTAWGAAFGGTNRTGGDPLVGSHDLSARAGGVAAGLDYHFSRDAVFGFAFAGGGTDWSLAQGLGGGKSDAFQAGVYTAARSGPAYLAAALAFANHWMSTDRVAAFGDHLTASFNAQSIGGRVEGGYRLASPAGGVTPYAALTAQEFRTPAYSETDVSGGGFALSYNVRSATDTRSELGARFDHEVALDPSKLLTLRGRLAWAHDWVSDPTLAPVFQALPGASFIVNGATPAKDSALASAGAELRLPRGVTLLGKFDGEFASHAQTYAGTGTLRVSW